MICFSSFIKLDYILINYLVLYAIGMLHEHSKYFPISVDSVQKLMKTKWKWSKAF